MKGRYIEVTFRKGKPSSAYLYLPPWNSQRIVRSEEAGHGMVIDFGQDDRPIGIELTAPDKVTLDGLNAVLKRLNLPPMKEEELAPLAAA